MQYLKSANKDPILQCYLDISKFRVILQLIFIFMNLRLNCNSVEDFNERIRNPYVETDEIDYLYRDAWDLYSVYFSHHSPNCIVFKKDLVSSLRKGKQLNY